MSSKRFDKFDPDNISSESMKFLAEKFQEYFDELESVMIIPEEISSKQEDQINEAIKRVRKLIKKLKNGDDSVFKDPEEWNSVL